MSYVSDGLAVQGTASVSGPILLLESHTEVMSYVSNGLAV